MNNDLSDILKFLDQVKATADAATHSPWFNDHGMIGVKRTYPLPVNPVTECFPPPTHGHQKSVVADQRNRNATFIASSRQRIPQLEQALRVAVEALEEIHKDAIRADGALTASTIEAHKNGALHTIATICHES